MSEGGGGGFTLSRSVYLIGLIFIRLWRVSSDVCKGKKKKCNYSDEEKSDFGEIQEERSGHEESICGCGGELFRWDYLKRQKVEKDRRGAFAMNRKNTEAGQAREQWWKSGMESEGSLC